MLKKYWTREYEDMGHISGAEDELNLFTPSLHTETYKDANINLELTEEQRGEVMETGKTVYHFDY